MTMNVIYDTTTGRVIATGDAVPEQGQSSADIPENRMPDDVTGYRVDNPGNPNDLVDDPTIPGPGEVRTEDDVLTDLENGDITAAEAILELHRNG